MIQSTEIKSKAIGHVPDAAMRMMVLLLTSWNRSGTTLAATRIPVVDVSCPVTVVLDEKNDTSDAASAVTRMKLALALGRTGVLTLDSE